MNPHRHPRRRPASGPAPDRPWLVLGLLALLLQPLATLGHAHAGHAHAGQGDRANCPVCLWQTHLAAELPPAPPTATPRPLGLTLPPCAAAALDPAPARADARAPPGSAC